MAHENATPRPWVLSVNDDDESVDITSEDRIYGSYVPIARTEVCYSGPIGVENDANPALIVEAVNAYDTLRAENERLASKVSDLEASLHDEETRVRHYRELVEESRKRGKANRPDMFWLADDPEFSLESWEDALEDAGMSDAVRVQCARGMADRWVARRVVSVTDDGDWDETDVMLCDTREEAESLWETSLAAARAALSEAQP